MSIAPSRSEPALKRALLAMERHTWVTLSPDGRQVAFVRTLDAGPEIWLRPVDGSERRLAAHHGELVSDLRWTADSSTVVYRSAGRGREHWSLAALRVATGDRLEIPVTGAVTEFWLSRRDPSALVYSSRTRSRTSELLRVRLDRLESGSVSLAEDPRFHRWIVDDDLRPRGGVSIVKDGSVHVVVGDDLSSARRVLTIEVDDAADLAILRLSGDGRLFVLTSSGAATRRLIAIDTSGGDVSTVFEHPALDVETYPIAGEGVWFDSVTGLPDMCAVMGQRPSYTALSPSRREIVRRLAPTATESPAVVDRSADDRTWLLVGVRDDGPLDYRVFEPASGRSQQVLLNRPELAGYELPKLEDLRFTASDGVELSGYMMRPLHREPPLPTVVMVHGGPNGRDYWRFNADAQYFASLGYLSLHVNYRGSRGFGREFRLAGNGEWGGRMQDDLYDAVAHAVASELAAPDRIAFFGASYGGYASVFAACTRPALVRCAVAISAPCDLVSFALDPPPYWQPLSPTLRRQILVARDGRRLDRASLERRSPVHVVDGSCSPLLVAHGARDPRVPVADVDKFVKRAQARGVSIRYQRFEDEGHHLRSNRNIETFFHQIETFLEDNLD